MNQDGIEVVVDLNYSGRKYRTLFLFLLMAC